MAIFERQASEPKLTYVGHMVGYFAPFVLAILSYVFIAPLRRHVFSAIPQEEYLYFFVGMIIIILLNGLWMVVDFFAVSDIRSSGDRIKQNAHITYVTAIIFVVAAGWFSANGELPWWLAIGAFFAVIDGGIVINRGINSALLKRVLQEEPSN